MHSVVNASANAKKRACFLNKFFVSADWCRNSSMRLLFDLIFICNLLYQNTPILHTLRCQRECQFIRRNENDKIIILLSLFKVATRRVHIHILAGTFQTISMLFVSTFQQSTTPIRPWNSTIQPPSLDMQRYISIACARVPIYVVAVIGVDALVACCCCSHGWIADKEKWTRGIEWILNLVIILSNVRLPEQIFCSQA